MSAPHGNSKARAKRLSADTELVHAAWQIEDRAAALLPVEVVEDTRLRQSRAVRAEALRAAAKKAGHPEALRLLRDADALFWQLALRHRGIGLQVAGRCVPRAEASEREQWAMIGLFQTALRFEPARGLAFGTYATWWVRAIVIRELVENGRIVEIPHGLQQRGAQLARFERAYPEASDAETAEMLGVPLKTLARIREARIAGGPGARLDAPVGDDTDTLLVDVLAADGPTPEDVAEDGATARRAAAILEALPPRERKVLARRVGWDGEAMNLAQIGAEDGLSRERIRQIERTALARARDFGTAPVVRRSRPAQKPSRPPETPVPATAPTSAPSSTSPGAPSPVAAGVGGGASSQRRRCRWPGHEEIRHESHGLCMRDLQRVRKLGLNPATLSDEDVAGLPALWEQRLARNRETARDMAARARAAKVGIAPETPAEAPTSATADIAVDLGPCPHQHPDGSNAVVPVDARYGRCTLCGDNSFPLVDEYGAAEGGEPDPRDARIAELETRDRLRIAEIHLAADRADKAEACLRVVADRLDRFAALERTVEGRVEAAVGYITEIETEGARLAALTQASHDVLDLAEVPREGTPAERVHRLAARAERAEALGRCLDGVLFGGVDRPASYDRLVTEDRRLVAAVVARKASVATIVELLDRVEAPRLAEDGETELPLDARVAWLTDGFRSEMARAEKAEADLREAREIKTGQDRAFVEATAFAQQEAAKREAVLVERAEKAEVALATLRACLDEALTPGAEARDFGLAEEDRHRIRSFVERVDASRAAVVEEPRVPAVARPVDVSRELVIFASLVESVEADMLAGADTAMRARLVPLFRALRALGGVA